MNQMAKVSRKPQAGKSRPNSPGPLVAVVIDPSFPYDREIATGVAQYAREVGDWRLYVEEEHDRRVPHFDAWPGQGIIASFDTDRVARRVVAARLPVVAVIGVDDDEFVCELSDPPLSSVAQAARRVGYEAARLLDRLMQPKRFAAEKTTAGPVPSRTVIPPVGVVARRSTDTLAVEDPVVAAAIRTIRERAVMGLGIAELVAESKLSRWQLEDRFRRAVGRSIHEDMLHVRLGEARRLVTTTDLPLKQIAPRSGFRSVAYMTTLFRRHFNATPAALRASARGRGESTGHQ
jgi:AraC-like DNA-binding protein